MVSTTYQNVKDKETLEIKMVSLNNVGFSISYLVRLGPESHSGMTQLSDKQRS